MDEKSWEILEFPQIIAILAGYTSFSASRELAFALKPLTDYDQIALRLEQSAEARHLLAMEPGFSIGGVMDIREAVRIASLEGILEPMRLVEIQQTLAAMRQTRSRLRTMSEELPRLWDIAKDITELRQVEKEIARCISLNGDVLDRASPNVAAIRRQLREEREHLWSRLEAIIRSPRGHRIIQEPIITEREGRYVIPVKIELRREIRGITHDVSNTGATVFVEPWSTMELGNTVRELVNEEKREVERILRKLSAEVGSYAAELSTSIEKMAELDLTLAKARYARSCQACEPVLKNIDGLKDEEIEAAVVKLVEARHPLLGEKAVPLSVEIGRDFSTLVITGPNTGGKTVALKTIGLFSLMTQAGIPVPASSKTCLPVFDSIFADIGDEQSIEQTLSSFSWHVGNIVRIIRNATPRSLVLLDELGTSTDPAEGSALARSVLLYFREKKILTVATTHYGDLKAFAHTTPGIENASFDFDPATFTPTYHLTVGIPGGSNALATATRLGLPSEIIDEARSMLSKGALELESLLSGLMAEKQKTGEVRVVLERERDEAQRQNAEIRERLQHLREEEQRALQEARDGVVREAAELHRQIRQASSEMRREMTRERLEQAKKALQGVQERLHSEAWSPKTGEPELEQRLSTGDTVYLKDIGLQATVLAVFEETQEVEVQAGQLKLKTGLENVEKVTEQKPASTRGTTTRAATKVISTELDLRGKRADEVEVALDIYLNDAALANLSEVRVIHGKGTGTVRQIVRDFLAAHPLVKSFRTGRQDEGGDGATVVSL
ncbi:MAG TPA: endonuclease MutS2 [Dehalococcoidia bacterium]|nr:endonuclease MutS2 [Dehalococcoidia bacterium]